MTGTPNYDAEAGIHYGVIHTNSCNPDAVSDIYDNGENLSYVAAVDDAKQRLASAIWPILDDLGVLPYDYRTTDKTTPKADAYVSEVVESIWNSIEQDWNDQRESDGDDQYQYNQDGYNLLTTSLGIYVCKSPYYTYAAACSPCCPNAGNLDTPRLTPEHGLKTYCLGPDWFDDEYAVMPYTAYNVVDDTEVTK